jgi:hypothetical protein
MIATIEVHQTLAIASPRAFAHLLERAMSASARNLASEGSALANERWVELRDAIMAAADCVGADGYGRDGAVGYFSTLARVYPRLVVRLIIGMLLDSDEGFLKRKRRFPPPNRRAQQARQRDVIVAVARQTGEDGRGRNGLVGYLRRISISHPIRFTGLVFRVIELEAKYFHSETKTGASLPASRT